MPKLIKSRKDLSSGQRAALEAFFSEHFSLQFLEFQLALLGQNEGVQNAIAEFYADKYIRLVQEILSAGTVLSQKDLEVNRELLNSAYALNNLRVRGALNDKEILKVILTPAVQRFSSKDNTPAFWAFLKDYFKKSLRYSHDPELIKKAYFFRLMAIRANDHARLELNFSRIAAASFYAHFLNERILAELEVLGNLRPNPDLQKQALNDPIHAFSKADAGLLFSNRAAGASLLVLGAWLLVQLSLLYLLCTNKNMNWGLFILGSIIIILAQRQTIASLLPLRLERGEEIATRYLNQFREIYSLIETQFKDPTTGERIEAHVAYPRGNYTAGLYEGPAAPSYLIAEPTAQETPLREGPKIKRRGIAAANQVPADAAPQGPLPAIVFANGISASESILLVPNKKLYGHLNERALETSGVNALSIKHFRNVLAKAKFAQAKNDSGIKLVKGSPFMRTPEGIRPFPYKLKIIASGVDSGARVFGHLVEGKNEGKLIEFDTYLSGKKSHQPERLSAQTAGEPSL
jgi:hypothetical protein